MIVGIGVRIMGRRERGIDFITVCPNTDYVHGSSVWRKVFVILSRCRVFCEDGDAIRVWAAKRENRFLVVVEDKRRESGTSSSTIFQTF